MATKPSLIVEILFTPEARVRAKQGAALLGKPLPADFTGPRFTHVEAFGPSTIEGMIAVTVPYLDAEGTQTTYMYHITDIARIKVQ